MSLATPQLQLLGCQHSRPQLSSEYNFIPTSAHIQSLMSIRTRTATKNSCPQKLQFESAGLHTKQGLQGRKKTKREECQAGNKYEQIPELPVVKLTLEDMNSDPIALLACLEQKYRDFGAVKLCVCEEWECPFTFRYVDKGITTRVQKLQSLKYGKAFEQNIETHSIRSFEAVAINFQNNYRFMTKPQGSTIESTREHEYWNLVTKPQFERKEVKVEYAADLPSTRYGSGFPTCPSTKPQNGPFEYHENLFNLNNIRKSRNSLLKITEKRKQKISGITHPWVYMGMLFSTFCWHVEDLWVNSINYSHKGAIKTWYVVPGDYKQKFDEYVKSKYCSNHQKKYMLRRITFMVDPLELIEAGIPVYKTYQCPKDYIYTFFKAYHCGFSQGFNVGEAVNFLSPHSLPVMLQARKAKKMEQKASPNVLSLEWLIIENYERLEQLKDHTKIIKKAYNDVINRQEQQLSEVIKLYNVGSVQIIPRETKYEKIMCSACKEYLYMSAYRVQPNNKVLCYEHLRKHSETLNSDKNQKHHKASVSIVIREPKKQRVELLNLLKPLSRDGDDQDVKVNDIVQ